MRRTPPVVVHLAPQPAVQAAVTLIAVLAAGGLAAWGLSHDVSAWPVLVLLPPMGWAAWRMAAVQPRRLRWDGQAWWLSDPARESERAVQMTVLIDLNHWMLLLARPTACWLPLSRRQQAPHWTALRATLFSAPPSALPPA